MQQDSPRVITYPKHHISRYTELIEFLTALFQRKKLCLKKK